MFENKQSFPLLFESGQEGSAGLLLQAGEVAIESDELGQSHFGIIEFITAGGSRWNEFHQIILSVQSIWWDSN